MRGTAFCLALSVSFASVASYAQPFDNREKENLEFFRINYSIPYVAQKAHHAHWCVQAYAALKEWQRVNEPSVQADPKLAAMMQFWVEEIQKFNVTDKQIAGVRYQVEEFYGLGPSNYAPNIFAMMHFSINCFVDPGEPSSLYLYNTTKQ